VDPEARRRPGVGKASTALQRLSGKGRPRRRDGGLGTESPRQTPT